MIEALASLRSYRPKDEDELPQGGDRNPTVDFHGRSAAATLMNPRPIRMRCSTARAKARRPS